jgi:hypothetical protein
LWGCGHYADPTRTAVTPTFLLRDLEQGQLEHVIDRFHELDIKQLPYLFG